MAGLYWQRHEHDITTVKRLGDLCGKPRLDHIDMPVLLGFAMRTVPLPWRTHIRGVSRIPFQTMVRIGPAHAVTQPRLATTGKTLWSFDPAVPISVNAEQLASLTTLDPAATWFADSGGQASALWPSAYRGARFAHAMQDGTVQVRNGPVGESGTVIDRVQVAEVETELSPAWPIQRGWLGVARLLIAAAAAGISTVVTGHGVRRALSATDVELHELRPGSWTGELAPFATLRTGYFRRRGRAVPKPADHPSWLRSSVAHEVLAMQNATGVIWRRWGSDWLREWADPGLAWVLDIADEVGVQLRIPAWEPDMMTALAAVPRHARIRIRNGLIEDAPLLRSLTGPGRRRVPGKTVRALEDATWAASADGLAALDRLPHGPMAAAGCLDSDAIRAIVADPFIRTSRSGLLRRLSCLDRWLGQS